MVSQDRWSLVTNSVAVRCGIFLPDICDPSRQVCLSWQWSLYSLRFRYGIHLKSDFIVIIAGHILLAQDAHLLPYVTARRPNS